MFVCELCKNEPFDKILIKPLQKSLKERVDDLTSLANLLRSDVKLGLDIYNPIFYKILHVPYFDPTYKLLERKVRSELLSVCYVHFLKLGSRRCCFKSFHAK